MFETFEEMCDDESICNYCSRTEYGEHKSCVTPNGYWSCEGSWCNEAYESYLEENEITENLVKYQNCVKLINKEDFNEQ